MEHSHVIHLMNNAMEFRTLVAKETKIGKELTRKVTTRNNQWTMKRTAEYTNKPSYKY